MKRSWKMIGTSALGNALEFYDFVICGVFIAKISEVFFPSSSPTIALFASIFAFSAAFFTRPLGAYVFGLIGDTFGRKVALTYSVMLMGFPTLVISLLPGYNTLGIAAPIILVLCRMVQGLSTGGEYNGAAIFAIEHGQAKQVGLISGIIAGSCMVGAVFASFAGSLVLQSGMPDWAWRVPFFIGALVSFMGFVLRKNAKETDAFIHIANKKKQQKQPMKTIFKSHKGAFLMNIIVGVFKGSLTYTVFGFMNVYMTKFQGYEMSTAVFLNTFGLLGYTSGCVFFGWLSDKITMRRSVYLSCFLCCSLSYFSFYLLQTNDIFLAGLGQYGVGLYVGSFVGLSHAFMQVLFPPETRYTGIAVSFSIGIAISGGFMPSIYTFMTGYTENMYMAAIIISIYAIIFTAISRFYRYKATLYSPAPHYSNENEQEETTKISIAGT
ncbi:MAG: MFS transporter [Proteobacteria bacterium]|nr:MFS transporter [Pseudomonadota bacterium]